VIDSNKVIVAHNAKQTSIDAAQKVLIKSGSIRRKVYEYILAQGLRGATDQEIERALHIEGNTIRPSRKSLEKDAYIIDSGTVRKNHKDNDCTVWRAVEQGMML
jgi:transcription initiation factor IIE alpha subunit